MSQTFRLWQNAWRDDPEASVILELPEDWIVTEYRMPADNRKPLTGEELADRIRHPVGMPSIRSLAAGGREAAIVFDDLSRGTPAGVLVRLVIEELLAGGLGREHIRLLCDLGNHAPLTRADFVQKLGEELVEQFPIYNHNPYENLVCVGTDRFGDEVLVNREFMQCDVRIGVGSVSPHPMNGFGGGGKLIFPGLAGIRTTHANHTRREFRPFSPEPCGLRRDIETMTEMVMPFFKIDAILNSRLEIVELRAGEPRQEHRQAVALSMELNGMHRAEGTRDVVFVNANAKYNEALIAIRIAAMDLKPGGDVVLVNHCPAGQVVHYLYSAFGSDYGGGCWQPYDRRPRSEIGRIIYYTPYPDVASRMSLSEPDKVVFAKTWNQVMSLLRAHGPETRASVITDGTISCFLPS